MFFLNPNTSVVSVNLVGPSRKVPLYVTAFVINGSEAYPVSLQFVLGTLDLLPGSYSIADKNSTTIYLPQFGLTATFQNWSLVGDGYFTSPANSPATSFNVYGSLVLTIVYKALTQTFSVKIMPNGIPLESSMAGESGVTLTSMNYTIPVYVDDKLLEVGANGTTLTLTEGYHIIEFPTNYNITFDYQNANSSNSLFKNFPGGEVITYQYKRLSTSTSNIKVVGEFEVYVNGSGTVYGDYYPSTVYYLVIVKNNFSLPSGVYLCRNSTPVLGDIAGQLLEVGIGGNSYAWGPIKEYVPQEFYLAQGTSVNYECNYLLRLNSTFVLNITGQGQVTAYVLFSNPRYVELVEPSGSHFSLFSVSSPVLLVNYQEWEYYGTPPSK